MYCLPSSLPPGAEVHAVDVKTGPDGHSTFLNVGSDIEPVWIWRPWLDESSNSSEGLTSAAGSDASVRSKAALSTPTADPVPKILPPVEHATDLLDRVRESSGLPERNHEDVVKDLLVRLGRDVRRIVFQVGRIDVAVQDSSGRTFMVVEVKRSLTSAPQRDDALRKGFDYASRNGARIVVITDGDHFEIYDRTRGFDHAAMLCGSFRLTGFRESDVAALDLLRPR